MVDDVIGTVDNLLRVMQRVTSTSSVEANRCLAPYKITYSEYRMLTLIRANEKCKQADIATDLCLSKARVNQVIDNLASEGLVTTKWVSIKFSRQKELAITESGKRILAGATIAYKEYLKHLLMNMDLEHADDLTVALNVVQTMQ